MEDCPGIFEDAIATGDYARGPRIAIANIENEGSAHGDLDDGNLKICMKYFKMYAIRI